VRRPVRLSVEKAIRDAELCLNEAEVLGLVVRIERIIDDEYGEEGPTQAARVAPTFLTADGLHPVRIVQLVPCANGLEAVFVEENGADEPFRVKYVNVQMYALIERDQPGHGVEQDVVALVPNATGEFEIAQEDPGFAGVRDRTVFTGEWTPAKERAFWVRCWQNRTNTESVIAGLPALGEVVV
jgi:hypothetical protein